MSTSRINEPAAIDLLTEARRSLLDALKRAGWATIPELAEMLAISNEAVRQQLTVLQREGWINSNCGPGGEDERPPGRPAISYCLSARGDDLFPKKYAGLALLLFDELADPEQTLTMLTDRRVRELGERVRETSAVTAATLKAIYRPDDSYIEIEESDRGTRLIEWNCPYLQFARERPSICSTTVSTLRRITGHEVVREERFQDGDGRCVFHIYRDAPMTRTRQRRRFEPEPPKDGVPATARSRTRRGSAS
jgi:predicted ArsR family transcriptional regulator